MILLTPGNSNTKTAKHAADLGVEAAILHLAPAALSGFNVCPFASPGCAASCLNTAGHGHWQATQDARVRRARWLMTDQAHFMATLTADLESLIKRATKRGATPAARLNGTSDIAWERYAVTRGDAEYPHVFAAFPEISFYDYTKNPNRLERCRAIPNYALTFSLSESNDRHAARALDLGFNVAAVLRGVDGGQWSGRPVIDGDAHDFRFMDPTGGYIVALSPKGKARFDRTGFVRDAADAINPATRPTFARRTDAPRMVADARESAVLASVDYPSPSQAHINSIAEPAIAASVAALPRSCQTCGSYRCPGC